MDKSGFDGCQAGERCLPQCIVPTVQFWQQFGGAPFLFNHDNAPLHKVRSIQKWFVEIGVEEIGVACTEP